MTSSGRTSQRVAGEEERRWVGQIKQAVLSHPVLESNLEREHVLQISQSHMFSGLLSLWPARPFCQRVPQLWWGKLCKEFKWNLRYRQNSVFLLSQWILKGWPKAWRRQRGQGEWVSVLPLRQVNAYKDENILKSFLWDLNFSFSNSGHQVNFLNQISGLVTLRGSAQRVTEVETLEGQFATDVTGWCLLSKTRLDFSINWPLKFAHHHLIADNFPNLILLW